MSEASKRLATYLMLGNPLAKAAGETAQASAGLAEALFDAAFPGEREDDPCWFQSYEQDWAERARRLLASDWFSHVIEQTQADERSRIARAIEAERSVFNDDTENAAYDDAAQIARRA